jgi:2-keto-4-pentenoate hydratase/2-oxohepta-3-ene-1,7-dioic acid hydratase in catechol pathway
MKLLRYGEKGAEKPGLLDAAGQIRDLSGHLTDIAGPALHPEALARLASLDPASLPLVAGSPRIGPCVGQVGKFVCIGLNYSDHAAEGGMKVPPEPVIFMKATSAICGPHDPIELPRGSVATDWEIELGLVIGKPAKYVEEAEALDYLAGYCTVNDVSERDFQARRSGQWTKGKSADSFGPIGPWLVTADEIDDPQALRLTLSVNGETCQDGTTANMVYGAAFLISYVSQFMSLQPGDIISTGTPAGVGMGRTPPRYLQPGDLVEAEVEKLGRQCQQVVAG